jgi:hypothetical protein
MTLRFNSNVFITTVEEGYFAIKEFMKSASPTGPGWTIKSSCTGNSGVYGSGDLITSASLIGRDSWFILQDPSGNREILYVMYPTNGYNTAYIMYSKSDGFTGGDTTSRPTATDEVCVFGQQTLGVFTYAQLIAGSLNIPSYIHLWADDSGEYAHGWWLKKSGSDYMQAGFVMDEIIDYPSNDIDHVVFTGQNGNYTYSWEYRSFSNGEGGNYVAGTGCTSWLKINKSGSDEDYFGKISLIIPSNNNYDYISGAASSSLKKSFGKTYSNENISYPLVFCNSLNQDSICFYKRRPYYKGISKYLKWNSAGYGICLGNTISINSPRDYIVNRAVMLPWDGGYLMR